MLVNFVVMVGQIFINGQIGANPEEKGVNLIDVIAQVKNQPFATSFEVYINSEGGYVDVGFDIHDYLRSLKLPIKTIGVGLVASIATVIFMAGDERILKEGTQFMIHLPSGAVEGNSEEIAYYHQMMQDTQSRLVKFYTNTLALTEEAIVYKSVIDRASNQEFSIRTTSQTAIGFVIYRLHGVNSIVRSQRL